MKIRQEKCFRGLLITVDGSKVNKIPKTDIDIMDIIENNSSYSRQYYSFVQNNINKSCLIVLNLIIPEGSMFIGWIHFITGVPKGFRKGNVNLKIAFNMSKNKGIPVSVTNCHQNRLLTRGGDGANIVWKKAVIIGCGSIGSFLADALKFYGTEHFALVDNEKLEYDNIARHSCGYFGVGLANVNVKVLDYYGFVNDNAELNEFAEVEALEECKTDDNEKYCTKKLRIDAKIGITGLVKAFVDFTFSKIDFKNASKSNTGYQSAATVTEEGQSL